MKYKNLIIEKKEYVLLKRYMNLSVYYKDETFRKSVKKLVDELEVAQVRDEVHMPKDIVRFNSTVTIASEKGWRKNFKLVMPNHSDAKNGKISILTPMATAVIGYAEGDSVTWEFASGEQKIIIEELEQENIPIPINIAL